MQMHLLLLSVRIFIPLQHEHSMDNVYSTYHRRTYSWALIVILRTGLERDIPRFCLMLWANAVLNGENVQLRRRAGGAGCDEMMSASMVRIPRGDSPLVCLVVVMY